MAIRAGCFTLLSFRTEIVLNPSGRAIYPGIHLPVRLILSDPCTGWQRSLW